MNDKERASWIDNDEGLYNWWKSSRFSKSAFVKVNRLTIDAIIDNKVNNRKPHSLLELASIIRANKR